jgi:hypothetical protein
MNSVLNDRELNNQQLNIDSDVEMNSLGNNSLYEQAWDNYQVIHSYSYMVLLTTINTGHCVFNRFVNPQEKYMSEAYSEPLDVETARRLLDFGDDYRNYLDSQSECASSISAIPATSPLPKTRTYHVGPLLLLLDQVSIFFL